MTNTATPTFEGVNAHNFTINPHEGGSTVEHLERMIDHARRSDERKIDTLVRVNTIHAHSGKLIYPANIGGAYYTPQALTDHSFRQLMKKLAPVVYNGGAAQRTPSLSLITSGEAMEDEPEEGSGRMRMPTRHFQAIPTELFDYDLNYFFEHAAADRRWYMRAIEPHVLPAVDEDTPSLSADPFIRAIVGNRYPTTFGNLQLLEGVHKLVQKNVANFPDITLVRPSLDDNHLRARFVYYQRDVPKGGAHGVGFFLGNDEIGKGKYRVSTLIQVGACTNSIIVDNDNSIGIVHVGSAPTILETIYNAIRTVLELGEDVLDEFLATREVEVPDFSDVVDGLALRYGNLFKANVTSVVKNVAADQGGATKMGLINGVTFAAHAAGVDAHTQVELERMGGQIIAAPMSLFAKAAEAAQDARMGKTPDLAFSLVRRSKAVASLDDEQ